MTAYLLDTDICIYWLNGVSSVRQKLQAVGVTQTAISIITLAELNFGAYRSAKVPENMARIDSMVQQIIVLQLTVVAAKIFGQLKADFRAQGQPLPDLDLLIASTALAENRCLVTNNNRHYSRVPSLTLENWLA